MRDATTAPKHIDRKRLKELRRLKMTMGHNPNDHEEQTAWQQKL